MDTGVAQKITACKASIPAPVVLAVSRRMNTHVTTTCLDISFKSGFLEIVEHISGGTQENHRRIFFEAVFIEHGRICGSIHVKIVLAAQQLDSGIARCNGLVVVPGCFTKDQNFCFTSVFV